MKKKVCFMFINANCKEEPIKNVMNLGQGEMIIVGVGSYDMACLEAIKLAEEGVIMIELCGGFGTIGCAKVTEAVNASHSPFSKICIGVVRFDNHPGYNNVSGDSMWLE